ncbi:MAG: hypothetical protein ABI602_04750 [Candidatus Saccharibacteria bacterium]
MKKLPSKRLLGAGFMGVLLGALVILGIRFVTYAPPQKVHYHANFAVYMNGQREAFKGVKYYEETAAAACTLKPVATALERAHLHDNVSDVVHVEDSEVTWGNFFQNIGWDISQNYIKSDTVLYQVDAQSKLTFIVNGEVVTDITNRIIQSEDKLLVSYGVSQDTATQFRSVAATAKTYNVQNDPESCSGSTEPTFKDKLKSLF